MKLEVIAENAVAPLGAELLKFKGHQFCISRCFKLKISNSNNRSFLFPPYGCWNQSKALEFILSKVKHMISLWMLKVEHWDWSISFRGDNMNRKFCRAHQHRNNVLTKWRNLWRRNVLGIGCSVHKIHNFTQRNCNILPTEIEATIFKTVHIFKSTQLE